MSQVVNIFKDANSVSIQMGNNCASLVANLILFYYERDVMLSRSDIIQPHVIETCNST